MPRWTAHRRLTGLPRARDFVTPGGYRVPVVLRWHLLVEHSQRHGLTLTELQSALGIPKGANMLERRQRMRVVTVEELRGLEDWVAVAIARTCVGRGARHPLADSRRNATGRSDAAA